MAIIYSYPENNNILPTDILVCTSTALINGKPKNQTKNISIADLTAFMALNGDNLNDVLTNGNTSLLSANIGQLGLFDAQAQNYGSLELSSSEFNFYNTSNVLTSTLTSDSLILYPNSYSGQLLVPNTITTDRVYTFQDASGTVAFLSDIPVAVTPDLQTVLTAGNISQIDAKVGGIFLYNNFAPSGLGYVSITGEKNRFNFYNNVGSYYANIAQDTLSLVDSVVPTRQFAIQKPATIAATRIATFQDASGTIAYLSDIPVLTGFVPYIGATQAVDLGAFNLTVNNISVGKGTGTGIDNTVVGEQALISNTIGNTNTAIGKSALKNNTTGYWNTAIGTQSQELGETARGNVSMGRGSLQNNLIGIFNIALGYQALFSNLADKNTVVGGQAMYTNTTGTFNTVVGQEALRANIAGSFNSIVGCFAILNAEASYVTALGRDAGRYSSVADLLGASESIFIGYNSRALNTTSTNEIVIGANAIGAGNDTITIGNTTVSSTRLRGAVQGGSFVKDGGTSSQFLKADGSIDSSTYVSGSGTVGYIPKFSAASGITNSVLQDSGTGTITLDANPSNLAVLALKGGSGQASLVSYFFNNTVRFQTGSDASGNYRINVYNAGGSFVNCALLVPSGTTRVLINSTADDGVNNLQVNGSLIATSIKKTSGTSNQYLMADGSTTTSTSPEYKYNFSGSLTLTGTLTTTNLLTITIPANSLSDYLDLRSVMVQQSGPALAGFQIRVWHNSVNDFNTATRIANYSFGAGGADLFAQMTRKFSIQGGTLFGFPSTPSNATGDGSNPNAALSIAFNPAAINYLFVSVQLNNVTDTATLRNVNITT